MKTYLHSSTGKATLLRLALILMGLAAITIGVLGGEADTVLTKAVFICLECIGIG